MPASITLKLLIAIMVVFGTSYSPSAPTSVPVVQNQTSQSDADLDRDGLKDQLEHELAEKFAPILFHDPDEPNLPTSVRRFLSQTELWFYDGRCHPPLEKLTDRLQTSIPIRKRSSCESAESAVESHGTRSQEKKSTFFLKNVSNDSRIGSLNPQNWMTYFHCYPNDEGGVTIQYWRFYAYNTGQFLGHPFKIGSHGGDWEAIHIVLNASYTPVTARFLGHRNITTRSWSSLLSEETHLLVKSEKGGHTSVPFGERDRRKAGIFIRQETWSSGRVSWPIRSKHGRLAEKDSTSPPLVNLGEKTAPARDMEFLQYSGLWGSRESTGFFPRLRSGYWGPANNETGMHRNNFIAAWCEGMEPSHRERSVIGNSQTVRECYPTKVSR
jgi:hypothetical protein